MSCKNGPRRGPGWTQPISVVRNAFGDQYKATDCTVPGKGTLTIKFTGEDGKVIEHWHQYDQLARMKQLNPEPEAAAATNGS